MSKTLVYIFEQKYFKNFQNSKLGILGVAYLDGLQFQRVRGISYGEIWIFVTATCIIVLVLVTGVVVAHKKKRRKNSISSDKTNMAFCEDQTPHHDVFIYFSMYYYIF